MQSLPDEILEHIFALGSEPPDCERCITSPWRFKEPKHTCSCRIPFPFLVSSVCRRWRAVASEATRLWTTVRICSANTPSRLLEYLGRSGVHPLDIELIIVASKLPFSLEELPAIMDILLAEHHRWRRLTIVCPSADYLKAILSRLMEVEVPILQFLDIELTPISARSGAADDDEAWPRVLFFLGAPCLREVHLFECGTLYITSKLLVSLESISLVRVPWNLSRLQRLAGTSPSLTHLTLSCRTRLSTDDGSILLKLRFPALRSLYVIGISYSAPALLVLEAPELAVLQLEDITLDTDEEADLLIDLFKGYPNTLGAGKFPKLRSLRLWILEGTAGPASAAVLQRRLPEFLRLFADVEHLALRGSRTPEFLDVMTTCKSPSGMPEILLPKLTVIALAWLLLPGHVHAFKRFTLWRHAVGAPISSVWVTALSVKLWEWPMIIFDLCLVEYYKVECYLLNIISIDSDNWIQGNFEQRAFEGRYVEL